MGVQARRASVAESSGVVLQPACWLCNVKIHSGGMMIIEIGSRRRMLILCLFLLDFCLLVLPWALRVTQ